MCIVFAGNATDVMLTDDYADNSSLYLDLLPLLTIKLSGSVADYPF